MAYDPILAKLNLSVFKPLPLCRNSRVQTILTKIYPYNPYVSPGQYHTIPLSDQDKVVVVENAPIDPLPSHRSCLLIHGLAGSDQSSYMVRLTGHLTKQGIHVFRMNLRGCGPGRGLAKMPYHAGRSDDVKAVLEYLALQYPNSPVTVMGFSLGANILLKMAGETNNSPMGNLDSLVAVSPPLDLKSSVMAMMDPRNRLFHHHFVKHLLRDVKKNHPDAIHHHFTKSANKLSLYDFDNNFTAPICGFQNADEYYERSSAGPFVKEITLPTFILHAIDDPVVHGGAFSALPKRPNLDVLITEYGGHVAWLGRTGNFAQYGNQWMDQAVVEWVKWFDSQKTPK